MKNGRFSTNISLYVENDTKYGRSYNGRPIVGRSEPFSMTLNDLEWLTKFLVHSKFRCLLTPNKSSAVFSGIARNLIWGLYVLTRSLQFQNVLMSHTWTKRLLIFLGVYIPIYPRRYAPGCISDSTQFYYHYYHYPLGWHTLPSHANAEACLTGWPNA